MKAQRAGEGEGEHSQALKPHCELVLYTLDLNEP